MSLLCSPLLAQAANSVAEPPVFQNLEEATSRIPRLADRPYEKLWDDRGYYQPETLIFHDLETGKEVWSLSMELCTDLANIERRCAWSCDGRFISFIGNKVFWNHNEKKLWKRTWAGYSYVANADGSARRKLWGKSDGRLILYGGRLNNWNQERVNMLYCADGDVAAPVMKAARVEKDFALDGDLGKAVWKKAEPVRLERTLKEGAVRPEISTTVRCLWSDRFVYFAYECPYTKLTVFEPVSPKKRLGLWDRDVVEVFIGTDEGRIGRYGEFEIAPTNERLDVMVDLPAKDFDWNSGFESVVKVDEKAKVWRAEVRIPLAALSKAAPQVGTRWRLNLYRSDRAHEVFLAWSPTFTASAHTPERFGVLEFGR